MRKRLIQAYGFMLQATCVEGLTERGTNNSDQETQDFANHGIWLEPVRAAMNGGNVTPLGNAIMESVFDGSGKCDDRWCTAGFAITPICKECDSGDLDTLFLRCFVCIPERAQRESLLKPQLVRLALRHGEFRHRLSR